MHKRGATRAGCSYIVLTELLTITVVHLTFERLQEKGETEHDRAINIKMFIQDHSEFIGLRRVTQHYTRLHMIPHDDTRFQRHTD